MPSEPPVIAASDDGHEIPDVGEWAEDKGRLLAYYCEEFATSMKDSWDERVYIDLFAGAGKVRARETGKVLLGSPLLALAVRHPFDRYIFCEQAPERLEALKRRVDDVHRTAQVCYIPGDVNSHTEQILQAMPSYSKSHKVLGFCFADPFNLKNLRFATIKTLATRYMDFLMLIPAMDPQRAWRKYLNPGNHTVDDFLGTPDWRAEWQRENPQPSPSVFVARILDRRMKELGFTHGGFPEAVLVRSTAKNAPLYRLGFFTKHPLGDKFWRQAKKGTSAQGKLF